MMFLNFAINYLYNKDDTPKEATGLKNRNIKLRIIWVIPNVFMYVLFIVCGVFVFSNVFGLRDINRLGIWLIMLALLLFASLFGSYRIWSWIKQGNM